MKETDINKWTTLTFDKPFNEFSYRTIVHTITAYYLTNEMQSNNNNDTSNNNPTIDVNCFRRSFRRSR